MSIVRPVGKPLDRPIRLGVLISGGGTTLANFVQLINDGKLDAEIAIVVASRHKCGGIARAAELGVPCEVVARRDFEVVEDFSVAIFERLRERKVDLVLLAGFLSLIQIPDDFAGRVMNIHPALIPAFSGHGFYGRRVHEAVLQQGANVSGCTVHFADNQYDHGPIILQKVVPVLDDDTPETLAARVFQAECDAYPEAIRLFAEGRLEIDDRHVRVADSATE